MYKYTYNLANLSKYAYATYVYNIIDVNHV